jgi:hypothetical protein
MTDYLKVRRAFMAAKLNLYELEALKGLVDAEIRDEEKQIKLWTIAGGYRLHLRDQFDVIKLALSSSNIRISSDRPQLTDFGEISWYISLKGLCPGRLKLDIDGVWSISEFKNRAVAAPVYTLTGLLARRQTDLTDWKLAN